MIRVLVADDHAVVRDGLRKVLESADDLEVVAMASNGDEAFALALEHRPKVILMDIRMPVADGIESTRRIVAAWPEACVVVLTSFSDDERILAAIEAGAVGYLLKDAEPTEIMRGVSAAARGESPLDPKAARVVLRARTPIRPEASLSNRENEVLELVRSGLTNKQIALRLTISEKTVKAHLTSIFRALGVTHRTGAAMWSTQRQLRATVDRDA